ncbi:S8 family serine peptidase [Solidesulfovibrio magneticus]|uniref:Alkaline serine protease n=1 Tax=Solidesulfovibrio magneticus (strain ATCC 700980 / DSM 13731 / RS-1) TaxID=573370 RepID=C4XLF1_SOLM1|nr:S8 family serine peptidase [Solidesulfovibrio magneticus]BAH77090.1 alkaline serine protease [Solidesulfovibrio magneticus RS-1]
MPPLRRNSRAVLAAFFVFWLFGVCSSALAGGKDLSWNALPTASLTENGQARVIVGFAVTDYDELATASRSHKVVTPEEAGLSRNAALAADAALARAVRRGADAVIADLPAKAYTVHRTYSALPYAALSVTPEGLAALRDNPKVTSIEVDAPVPLPLPVPESQAKGDDAASDSVDLPSANLNWGPPKIGADTAWARGYTGQGWHVAILDTGIRRTHEFFAGKTIVEACFSAAANCPGGTTSAYGTGSAAHYSSSLQGWDHGTHCAGIAAGKKADGSVAGVAKDANLIAVQVFSIIDPSTSPWVGSYPSDQLDGLNYVYSLRNTYSIAAASMSLGGGSYSSACDTGESRKTAIDQLRAVNIPTTIATGNDYYCSSIGAPACISSAIAVGASTSTDARSAFSNWHPTLQTIFAPGSSIYSSTGDSDTSYESWNGTSMATPHVAGAWALLRQNRPNDSVNAILTRLLAGSPSITTTCPSDGSLPRIFIPAALQAASIAPILPILLE